MMVQSLTRSLIPPPLEPEALARRCYEEQLIPDRLGVVRRSALLGDPDDPLVVADHRAWPLGFLHSLDHRNRRGDGLDRRVEVVGSIAALSRAERAAIMSTDALSMKLGGVTNRCAQGLTESPG